MRIMSPILNEMKMSVGDTVETTFGIVSITHDFGIGTWWRYKGISTDDKFRYVYLHPTRKGGSAHGFVYQLDATEYGKSGKILNKN